MTKSKYYKHPKFGHVYGDTIATPIGRASWPSLVTPKEPPPPQEGQQKGQPRYEVTLLIPKDGEKVKDWLKAVGSMTKAMISLYNQGKSGKLGECALLKDGDDPEVDLEKYPYYAGNWVLVARNTKQPVIKSTKKIEGKLEVLEPNAIIGGMKIRCVVTPLVTAHGVSYKLEWVQLVQDDGTRYGGGTKDFNELLEDISEEELEVDDIEESVRESDSEVSDEESEEAEEEDTPAVKPKKSSKGEPARVSAKGKQQGLKAGLKLI